MLYYDSEMWSLGKRPSRIQDKEFRNACVLFVRGVGLDGKVPP